MPLYEYQCPKCKYKFDKFILMEKMDTVVCPECGVKAIKLIASNVTLITDTSFSETGRVDKRLGKEKIQGRKDFERRAAAKGLTPITVAELKSSI